MTEPADTLRAAERQAGSANTAKQRGLGVDLLADGTLSLPSGISRDEAAVDGQSASHPHPHGIAGSLNSRARCG